MRTGIERCFALLVQRWRFLFKYVYIHDPLRLVKVIVACCVLHNVCLERYDVDTFADHVHRLEGNRGLTFHSDVHVEMATDQSFQYFETSGLVDEAEDQVDGFNKRERLLQDAKTDY